MASSIYLCQEDNSLNSIESLCVLLEKLDVPLLPAEVARVNYRNGKAALCFIQHIANYFHEELVQKVKASLVCGWMMDESTSRSTEKSCIIYVRYVENNEAKTSYYGLLDLQGDGTAKNIVKNLSELWSKDGLKPQNSCWLATDNAPTFTGKHESVIAKLRSYLATDFLELNTCVAHSFALVGSQSAYIPKIQNGKQIFIQTDAVMKLESTISSIYDYFKHSSSRQYNLKSWQNFMDSPELKFKKLFDIRWSSIRDCIKPIFANIEPGFYTSKNREQAKELFDSILDDEFLFSLHMHYDLHECILGPITKCTQSDHLSYLNLMEIIQEKRTILEGWTFQSLSDVGPALSDYIESTKNGIFGAFDISLGDRQKFLHNSHQHIHRLLQEIAKRFPPSVVQENLSVLFDPQHLFKHKNKININEYGRSALSFLRKKYKNVVGFDHSSVGNEWESLKVSIYDYVNNLPNNTPVNEFWKNFILLNIFLISPTNSAECEKGYSATNRIQTFGRCRLKILTLDVLMNVRMLLKDDLRRCQEVIDKSFESWNNIDYHRRCHQIQLLLDTPDDYEPAKQI
ncbi:unnamed protein product [Adineta ricciae]|uniref:HAT C-terminal dimerisation domain-containing protein n=1 Tax=Adineta ricciae TaxID=249248 RepID=A0A815H987_ADIRI|nr:unnamed protein product [Adineta ricciae]